MPHTQDGFIRCTIKFSDNSLIDLQTYLTDVSIPISVGRPKLRFKDTKNFSVKTALKSIQGTKIPSVVIKTYGKNNVLLNTYTYTNAELVPVSYEVSTSQDNVVDYIVELVADRQVQSNIW